MKMYHKWRSSEYGIETLGSITHEEILNQLSDNQLLKDFAPWI
jgi:hypothetical protein